MGKCGHHALPFAAFDLHVAQERRMVSHWWNLRPLSVEENHEKNGHYIPDELVDYKTAWLEKFGRRQLKRKPDCPF